MQTLGAGNKLLHTKPLRRALVQAALLLVAIGLLSVGVSGLLAVGSKAAWGDRFVAGDLPGVTYTRARCADFREYAPDARTCLDAAASHHTDEVVGTCLAAGLVGAVMLGVWALARRRDKGSRSRQRWCRRSASRHSASRQPPSPSKASTAWCSIRHTVERVSG